MNSTFSTIHIFLHITDTYYMDSPGSCGKVIQVSYKEKITIKGRGAIFPYDTASCSITLRSLGGGFLLDFDEGYINDCDVRLSLRSGSSTTSSVFVSKAQPLFRCE